MVGAGPVNQVFQERWIEDGFPALRSGHSSDQPKLPAEFLKIYRLSLPRVSSGHGLLQSLGVLRRAEQIVRFHPRAEIFGRYKCHRLLATPPNQDRFVGVGKLGP